MSSFFGYSRAAYYKSAKSERVVLDANESVRKLVQPIRHRQSKTGGKKIYQMIKGSLKELPVAMGRDKFFDALRANDMLVKRKKRFVKTTDSYHRFHKYKNRLKDVVISKPHQAYVSDITYLRAGSKFIYLFLQMDAYSRVITGWDLSPSLGIEGAIRTMKMTIKQSPDTRGAIHHSDRGIQYCCGAYVKLAQKAKMKISMTEQNHCYENAMAERLNGILKQEFLLDETFADYNMAYRAVKEAVSIYNEQRLHWSLDLRTPMQVHKAA